MNKYEQRILDYLNRPNYRPIAVDVLVERLEISEELLPKHSEALQSLLDKKRVRLTKKGVLKPLSAAGSVEGSIKKTGSGAGYLIPRDAVPGSRENDVYIPPQDMRGALTGDEVVVSLSQQRRQNGQRCGRVVDIIKRVTNRFVGSYRERKGLAFVQVDGTQFSAPIPVGDPGVKGAQPDDKVVIEMVRFPAWNYAGEAVLTKVLGQHGGVGVDTALIVNEFNLPDDFPEEVLENSRQQAAAFDPEKLVDRRDFTKEVVVTIDPADARDFDDAISLTQGENGHWTLGVHIADVAHFVRPGEPLDVEARSRGTSVYLPNRVIPMLPELISNGLASLQQGTVRFTKTAFIEFSPEGIPVHTEFARTAIQVNRRFAYEEVMPIVNDPDAFDGKVNTKVRSLLKSMHTLAMLLRKRRFKSGALELNLPEVELEFNKDGQVTGAHESEHDPSHQIIEEFMLAANVAVATELNDRGISFLRRIHPDPDEAKLKTFSEFVGALGFDLKRYQSRGDLQALIHRVADSPTEYAVNYALLRSLKQAEYSAEEVGHYALAEEQYCHFTSPIRRYPDLTVHRLIDQILLGDKQKTGKVEADWNKLGSHCSDLERRAATAERELTKVKLLTFMAEKVGQQFEAVITGVESFGIFCRLQNPVPVEGLVHISALSANDYFDHDRAEMSLVGRRSGQRYRLGDRIVVEVVKVDVNRRELDLRVLEGAGSSPKRSSGQSSSGKRSPGKSSPGKSSGQGQRKSREKAGEKTADKSPGKPRKRRQKAETTSRTKKRVERKERRKKGKPGSSAASGSDSKKKASAAKKKKASAMTAKKTTAKKTTTAKTTAKKTVTAKTAAKKKAAKKKATKKRAAKKKIDLKRKKNANSSKRSQKR